MSAKTIKDKKLEAKALLDGIKAIQAKGDEATQEEVVKMQADSAIVEGILGDIKKMSFSEQAKKAGELEASLSLLSAPERPALGGVGPVPLPHTKAEQWAIKSLGETIVESDGYKSFDPHIQGSAMGIEIKNLMSIMGHTKATFTTSGSTLTTYDRPPGVVLLEQQRLTVADLMAQGQTTSNTIRYRREDAFTNAATTVAEGSEKPEASFDTSEADAPVRKIAVTAKVTDELFADFPALQSYIDMRLRYMVGLTEEAQLLNGDGNSPNLEGILQLGSGPGTSDGIQTQAQGADSPLDAIHRAITKIRAVGFFEPDGVVIHPTDYQIIRLEKDANAQYYGGGPFVGQYGNNGYPTLIGPWGLRPVVTTAITAGTCLVGAYKMGAMVFRREGVTVQMTNSNEDDFKKNLIAIRVEERLAFAIWRRLAFCSVTGIAPTNNY